MSETIRELISEEDVAAKVKEIGAQITKDYEGKAVHLICVLKGGVFFTCELAKRIEVPVSLDFMSVSSYGDDTKSSGVVKIIKDLDESIEGKDVLIVGHGAMNSSIVCQIRNLPLSKFWDAGIENCKLMKLK